MSEAVLIIDDESREPCSGTKCFRFGCHDYCVLDKDHDGQHWCGMPHSPGTITLTRAQFQLRMLLIFLATVAFGVLMWVLG